MNEVLQRVCDWYVLSPREFYRKHLENFWERRKIENIPISTSDCGMMIETELELLPLGYSLEDETFIQARRRTVDIFLEKLVTETV